MQYRGEIDGLRALAVVSVILFHAGIQSFGGGFVGVDIFFVISGYLITSILLNDLRSGSFSLIQFYERRARRILPALFLVMFLCLPFAWLLLATTDMKAFASELIAVQIFSSNFLFWHHSGYFDTATELKPLIHTWSLAVEEQFYMIFPLLMLLAWRFGERIVVGFLILIFSISLAAAQWGAFRYPEFSFFMLPTRAWELVIGAFIATYYSKHNIKHHNHLIAHCCSFLGLLLILYSVFAFSKETPFPSLYALVPTVGTALIIIFATNETWVGKLLGSKPFVSIGLVSYSAYLWHQPLFAFARIRSDESLSNAILLFLAIISIALGYLSWWIVERPFRRKHKITRKKVFIYASVVSLCFIVIGITFRNVQHFSNYRMNKSQLSLLETAKPSPKRNECHAGDNHYIQPHDACEYLGDQITWAVLGDSHAVELGYSLASELNAYDVGIKHLSYSGCLPSFQMPEPQTQCGKWTEAAINYLDRTPAIRTVIVSYRLNLHLYGDHEADYPKLPNKVSLSRRIEIWDSYISLLRHLLGSGKRVVVVLQAPELSKSNEDLIFRKGNSSHDIVSVPAEWWKRRNAYIMNHLNTIPKDIKVINPADFFCDDQSCYSTRGGISLYFDDDHMSVAGADIIAKRILESLNE